MSSPPDDDDVPYRVGYRKPPLETRFQPGESGNPRGRPRGRKGTRPLFKEELNRKVFITEDGKRRRVSKGELLVKTLVNKAIQGSAKHLEIALARLAEIEPEVGYQGITEIVFVDAKSGNRANSVAELYPGRVASLDASRGSSSPST